MVVAVGHAALLSPAVAATVVVVVGVAAAAAVAVVAAGLCFRWRLLSAARTRRRPVVGFFHPAALGGGGGERVLWTAINAIHDRYGDGVEVVVYAAWSSAFARAGSAGGGGADGSAALRGSISAGGGVRLALARSVVRRQFGLSIRGEVQCVDLRSAWLLNPRLYPRFTLILQSLAAIPVAAEALYRYPPSLLIDTAGHPFLAFLTSAVSPRIPVVAYVHYPVISTDMLAVVASRTPQYNNASAVARSAVASRAKLVYYRRFAAAYAAAGARTAVAMTNSSWTAAHVRAIWTRAPSPPTPTVYPPCELSPLLALPLRRPRRPLMASVGQYRPEKRHELQLEVLAALRRGSPSRPPVDVKLIMVGGASTPADHGRVAALRARAAVLGLGDDALDIRVNVGRDEVVGVLGGVGLVLHTMVDEHFGIGVVEAMAAGAVVVAHHSGGVATDIVGVQHEGAAPTTTFASAAPTSATRTPAPATDSRFRGVLVAGRGPGEVDAWADAVRWVLGWPPTTYADVQSRAREWASRFGESLFVAGFLDAIGCYIEGGHAGRNTTADDDNHVVKPGGGGGACIPQAWLKGGAGRAIHGLRSRRLPPFSFCLSSSFVSSIGGVSLCMVPFGRAVRRRRLRPRWPRRW
ncbi:hypothetical protein MMPV_009159 [Pyropia vietnamensis]